jgi:hypothetical protein
MQSQNSIAVVESAMAEFKQKLKEKREKQQKDQEIHFENIKRANEIY